MKKVEERTRKLFLEYTYQVKKLEEITFARNRSMLERSPDDVLIMCTDAGVSASMMVFYIGKKT